MPRLRDFKEEEGLANLDKLAESLIPYAGISDSAGQAEADLIWVFPVYMLVTS